MSNFIQIILKIASAVSVASPVAWETRDDRKGDKDKAKDAFTRSLMAVVSAFVNHVSGTVNFWIALNMSAAFFMMFFDYLVNYVLIRNETIEQTTDKRRHWFTHIGEKGFDGIKFWRNLGPWGRFYVRLGYFLVSLFIYLHYGLFR